MTERLAVALVTRAEKDLLTPAADGGPAGTTKDLQSTVAFAMDLLVKLPKLRPPEDEEDGAGVDLLRAMLDDPKQVVERLHANPKFINALKAKGWLSPPARPPHRPTKEQTLEREAYEIRRREVADPEEADDSELQRMLKGQVG